MSSMRCSGIFLLPGSLPRFSTRARSIPLLIGPHVIQSLHFTSIPSNDLLSFATMQWFTLVSLRRFKVYFTSGLTPVRPRTRTIASIITRTRVLVSKFFQIPSSKSLNAEPIQAVKRIDDCERCVQHIARTSFCFCPCIFDPSELKNSPNDRVANESSSARCWL